MEIIAEEKKDNLFPHSHLHLPMQSQIALMFMAVMVMFAVFASLLNSWIITNNFEAELDEKAGQYIQFIFNGYLENITDLNNAGFHSNLKKILRDKDILSISLHDQNKASILGFGVESEIHASVFDASDNNTLLPTTVNDIRYYSYSVPSPYKNDYRTPEGSGINRNRQNQFSNSSSHELNYILLGFDSKMVFRTALNSFVWTFLLTILAAICMMFIAVVVIRNFTKPFDRLSSAMADAQLGERGVRVTPDGASEIYAMGLAFNSMISVLEKREDRLLIQKQTLEEEIKDRESAELALKDTTSRLQAIFQNAIDGIIVVNKEHEIISINPSAENIYGYNKGELVGEDFSKVMQSMFIRMAFGRCKGDVSAAGKGGYKTSAITKSGDEVPVEMGVSLMPVSEDENYLVIIRDISERIKSEKELNNYHSHLEAMVREQTKDIADSRDAAMAGERAMSTFLSNISHELRTPMHGVLSFASIALRKIDSVNTEKTKEYLGEIRTSGQHLLDIINDLLDLSKMKSGKMAYHHSEKSFMNIIENISREMSVLAEDKHISFNIVKDGDEFNFDIDEKRMMQVLRNLYANAIRFSDLDSSINISANFRDPDKFIFSIFNFGVCVPDNEREAIFDSFSQSSETATNAGGTGLGLPICKEIIESGHGGTIRAEPEIKNGARFVVEIPITHNHNVVNINTREVRHH